MHYLNQFVGILLMVMAAILGLFAWRSVTGLWSAVVRHQLTATGAYATMAEYAETFIFAGILFVLLGVGMIVLMHSSYLKFAN